MRKTRIFPEEIRAAADRRGLNISQLALKIGVSRQYMGQVLSEGFISDKSAFALAKALGVPVEQIGKPGRRSRSVRVDSGKLREAMDRRGLSNTELQMLSGLSGGSITRMRCEDVLVRRSSLERLARALRVNPKNLIYRGKEENGGDKHP